MRRLLAPAVFIALAFLLLWPRIAAPASGAGIVAKLPGPEGARAWLAAQRADLVAGNIDRRVIRRQMAAWREASRNLARTGGWTDPRRGYVIYPPQVTLDLFLLDRAGRMYAAALEARDAGDIPPVDELFLLGGAPLTLTIAGKYPSATRVRAALDSLALPKNVFQGYRIFLLPFAMGDVSGQGGPGFAFLAAEPRQEQLIPNQLEVTLVHEFGHYLHLAGMPRSTSTGWNRWQTYLSLRGIDWREDGRVKTADWARSPEETFAEDFRLLFGAGPAERESAVTLAGDPRQDRMMAVKLRHFMTSVAAGTRPGSNAEPWPEDGEITALPARIEKNWLAGTLLLAGLALAGYVASRKKRRRLPSLEV